MYDTKTPLPAATGNNLVDKAANAAGQGITATHHALDGLASGVQALRDQTSPQLDGVTAQAHAILHRSMDTLRDGTQQVRAKAREAGASTTRYIQDEPMKAVLIAAATGAALMALASLLARSRRDA